MNEIALVQLSTLWHLTLSTASVAQRQTHQFEGCAIRSCKLEPQAHAFPGSKTAGQSNVLSVHFARRLRVVPDKGVRRQILPRPLRCSAGRRAVFRLDRDLASFPSRTITSHEEQRNPLQEPFGTEIVDLHLDDVAGDGRNVAQFAVIVVQPPSDVALRERTEETFDPSAVVLLGRQSANPRKEATTAPGAPCGRAVKKVFSIAISPQRANVF